MTLPAGTNTTPESAANSFSTLDPPGNVNPPAIFEPDSDYTQGIAQLWLAASGGDLWGGAVVWISLDGDSYHPIGDIENPARQGQIVGDLDAGGDTLNVGLRGSFATIDLDVTHDDAVFGRTLCWIVDNFETDAPCDGELLAYGAATAGPLSFLYTLSDLNRGLYGTEALDHAIGSQFTRIDTAASIGSRTLTLLRFDLPADYIGVTLYLKFQSFNRTGQSLQDLADVTEYTYTPCGRGHTGPFGVPAVPTDFECTPLSGAGAIWLNWDDNPTSDAVIHYELYRASGLGTAFSSATLLETTKGAVWVDAGLDALSEWTYFVKACNAIGCSDPSDPSSCTATENTGIPLCDTPPEVGQFLRWDGTEWCPATIVVDDDDTCDMQNVDSGVDYTVTLTKFDTQVIWNSTDPGDKLTHIPAANSVNKGFTLDIKANTGDGSNHCIVPASGTIGSIASVGFTDAMTNLFLRSNADKNDWLIRCLCSYTPMPCTPFTPGAVSLGGDAYGWNFPAMSDSSSFSMSVWLYVSGSQFAFPPSPDGGMFGANSAYLFNDPGLSGNESFIGLGGFRTWHGFSGTDIPINDIVDITRANPAVITFADPHGIDANSYLSTWTSGFFNPAWATAFTFSGADLITAVSATTITVNVDTSAISSPWVTPSGSNIYGEGGVRFGIVNSIEFFSGDAVGSPSTGSATWTWGKALPPDTWINVLLCADTNHATNAKTVTLYFGETQVPLSSLSDVSTGPFAMNFGEVGDGTEDNAWKFGGSFFRSGVVCYMAEAWFAPGQFIDFTDPAIRAKFHDVSNHPVSLGADGSLPTGTAPLLYLSQPREPRNSPVKWIDPSAIGFAPNQPFLDIASLPLANGITTSSLLTFSFWIDRHTVGDLLDIGGAGSDNGNISLYNGLCTVHLPGSAGGKFRFTFPYSAGTAANLRVGIDMNHAIGAKIVNAYVNGGAAIVTVTDDDTNNMVVDWSAISNLTFFFYTQGYIGDLWVAPDYYVDPGPFFYSAGGPGALPPTTPSMYFHISGSDTADDFGTNQGNGGAFNITDGSNPGHFSLISGTEFFENASGAGALKSPEFMTTLQLSPVSFP